MKPFVTELARSGVEGVVIEEHIYHDAGATTPQHVQRAELIQWIRDAGRVPVERDTLYNVVWSDKQARTVAGAAASSSQ